MAINLTSIYGFIFQIVRAHNFYKVLVKELRKKEYFEKSLLGEGIAEGPTQPRANRSTPLTVILSRSNQNLTDTGCKIVKA